jgi:hypothetical protein
MRESWGFGPFFPDCHLEIIVVLSDWFFQGCSVTEPDQKCTACLVVQNGGNLLLEKG